MKKLLVFAGVAVAAVAGGAQTFAEFKAAVESAEAGSTVYLENDVEYTGYITLNNRLTITSPGDKPFTLRRADSYRGDCCFWVRTGSDVTITNLTLDGNSAVSGTWSPAINFDGTAGGSSEKLVTLGDGFSLVNFELNSVSRYAVVYNLSGRLYMLDGSVISNCVTKGNTTTVLVGVGSQLHMRGGKIVNCHNLTEAEPSPYVGGAVCLTGASSLIYWWDGEISGNTSVNGFGGVILDRRAISAPSTANCIMYLGGTGRIVGNTGGFRGEGKPTAANVWCDKIDSIWICPQDQKKDYNWALYEGAVVGISGYNEDEEGVGNRTAMFTSKNSVSGISKSGNIFLDRDPSIIVVQDSYPKDDGTNGYIPKWGRRGSKYTVDGAAAGTPLTNGFDYAWNRLYILGANGTIEVYGDDVLSTNAYKSSNRAVMIKGVKDGATSPDDRVVLQIADGVVNAMPFAFSNTSSLTLEDIILDGNCGSGASVKKDGPSGMINATGGAKVTLKKGAEVRNTSTFVLGTTPYDGGSAIYATGNGTVVRMESGSMVTNCYGSWGSGVFINGCKFEFVGGTVVGCDSQTGSAASGGNGGAVFIENGRLEMSGDAKVIGNKCSRNGPNAASGVMIYGSTAEMCVSGNAEVYGNGGTYGDVYIHSCKTGGLTYKGDFRGRIAIGSVKSASPAVDTDMLFRPEEGATGVWCFESHSGDLAVGADYKFAASVGTVGANRFATLDLINQRLLRDEEVDGNFQPIALTGKALEATISQCLVFDAKAMKGSDRLPLKLYDFCGGEFSGTAAFTFPDGQDKRWEVVAENGGLWLKQLKPGLIVTIR